MSKNKLTKEKFEERVTEKFGSKFEITYLNNDFSGWDDIRVTCKLHGTNTIKGHTFLRSEYGCAKCGNMVRASKTVERNKSQLVPWQDRVAAFRKVHGEKYSYPTVHDGNYRSKIDIECPMHGKFTKHIFAHIKGSGCQECKKETTQKCKKQALPIEERQILARNNRISANKKRVFPVKEMQKLFEQQHGNRFDYDWATYTGKASSIRIICRKHGEFWQVCDEHLKAIHACPSCACISKSALETKWLDALKISEEYRQHKIKVGESIIKVDGYDPDTNTVYEFLGDYWHGHPKWHSKCDGMNPTCKISFTDLYKITEARLTSLYKMQYNIIYVWENDDPLNTMIHRTFNGTLET